MIVVTNVPMHLRRQITMAATVPTSIFFGSGLALSALTVAVAALASLASAAASAAAARFGGHLFDHAHEFL